MGYVYGKRLKPVGDYLLGLLADGEPVRYGATFYDQTPGQEARLHEALGIPPEVDYGDDTVYPPIYADWAVGQFVDAGLVEIEELEDTLPDGEPDYTITITEKGLEFIISGQDFPYRDMDL